MARIRNFDKLNKDEKIEILIANLSLALREEVWFYRGRKTSIYGIACQFSGATHHLKKTDFDLIRDMTIDEIVNFLDRKRDMTIIENINEIYVCGDLHGDINISKINVKNFPQQKSMIGNNILLQAGDFGLIWNREKDKTEEYWLDWLDEKNFYTLFIAGNHENYDRLEKYPLIDFHGGKAAQISEKVFYLKNGYIYNLNGIKIWMFGGAYSVDKDWRVEGVSWWPQEIPSYKEMQFGLDNLQNTEIDYIVTHTLPKTIVEMSSKYVGDIFYEKGVYPCAVQSFLDNVLQLKMHKYKKWFTGHFHIDVNLSNDITILNDEIIKIK